MLGFFTPSLQLWAGGRVVPSSRGLLSEACYLNGGERAISYGCGPHCVWLGPHLILPACVPRSSAIRRSGSTSPLGFARASPSPPSHTEHGAALARKLSLGGGRPYTPSPQGEPACPWWTRLKWDWASPRAGTVWEETCSPRQGMTLMTPLSAQVGIIPERPGWSGAPSPQGAEMRGGRSPRPGRRSPGLGQEPASRSRSGHVTREGRCCDTVHSSGLSLWRSSRGFCVRPPGA